MECGPLTDTIRPSAPTRAGSRRSRLDTRASGAVTLQVCGSGGPRRGEARRLSARPRDLVPLLSLLSTLFDLPRHRRIPSITPEVTLVACQDCPRSGRALSFFFCAELDACRVPSTTMTSALPLQWPPGNATYTGQKSRPRSAAAPPALRQPVIAVSAARSESGSKCRPLPSSPIPPTPEPSAQDAPPNPCMLPHVKT